jgi:hypothetical protein
MGHNSSKFDKEAHYAEMTPKKLEELIVFYKAAIAKYPRSMTVCNEELGLVQMKLAERIGKKGTK